MSNDEYNKEVARGAGVYNERADSNAICERLVHKLTEKNDEDKPKASVTPKEAEGKMSDSEDSEKEDLNWASAPASPAPLKTPRAFEKSDSLYEKQLLKERDQMAEEWSWDPVDFLMDDRERAKQKEKSNKA